jgi:hypothetical protein
LVIHFVPPLNSFKDVIYYILKVSYYLLVKSYIFHEKESPRDSL